MKSGDVVIISIATILTLLLLKCNALQSVTHQHGQQQQVLIYVSPAGNDTTGDGSMDSPYQTLDRAMGVMSDDNSTLTSAWSVILANGNYTSVNDHLIKQSDSLELVPWPSVNFTSDRVSIDHIVLNTCGSQLAMRDVHVGRLSHTNIQCTQSSEVILDRVTVGSLLEKSSQANYTLNIDNSTVISSSIIINLGSILLDNGLLQISTSSQANITDCTMTNVTTNVDDNSQLYITNTAIQTIGLFDAIDIYATNSSTVHIDHSSFSTNGQFALLAQDSQLHLSDVSFDHCRYSSSLISLTDSLINIVNLTVSSTVSPVFVRTINSSLSMSNFNVQVVSQYMFSEEGHMSLTLVNGIFGIAHVLLWQQTPASPIDISFTHVHLQDLESITCQGCNMTLQHVTFPKQYDSVFGIAMVDSHLQVINGHFASLSPVDYLISLKNTEATIIDSRFTQCSNLFDLSQQSHLLLSNVTLDDMFSRSSIINAFQSTLVIQRSNMTSISSQINNTPLLQLLASSVHMSDTSFTNCNSASGLVLASESNSTLNMTDVHLNQTAQTSNPKPYDSGTGAIQADASTVILDQFTSDRMLTVLLLALSNSHVTINTSQFSLSSYNLLHVYKSNGTMNNSTVQGQGAGSVMFLEACPNFSINGTYFRGLTKFDHVLFSTYSSITINKVDVSNIQGGPFIRAEHSNVIISKSYVLFSYAPSLIQMYNSSLISRSNIVLGNRAVGYDIYMGSLSMEQSEVSDTSYTTNFAMVIANAVNVSIVDSLFDYNFASETPVYISSDQTLSQCYLHNNTLSRNTGSNGGAMRIITTSGSLSSGGCIFTKNSFIANAASGSGGAVFISADSYLPIDPSNIFDQNTVDFYGVNVATSKLRLNITEIDGVLSNNSPIQFTLTMLDGYNNTVEDEVGDVVLSVSSLTPTISNINFTYAIGLIGGTADVFLTQLIGQPSGCMFNINLTQYNNEWPYTITTAFNITVPSCGPFQFLKANSSLCQYCSSIYDVYSPSLSRCVECESAYRNLAQCYLDTVSTMPNYWMYNNDIEQIYHCQPNICLGDNKCRSGHTGVLCGQCIGSTVSNKSGIYCCRYILFFIITTLVLAFRPRFFYSIYGHMFIFLQTVAILLYPQINLYVLPLFRMSIDFIPSKTKQ
ncbi:hypothetical protein SAMD00019534_112720 [Acytostelium subglobosum LB1]|uniref:hypothetical protein n=1 Tax=Acytostelium subglobosum LB1 TaxID=1410327 RepID=UPI000644F9F0|nr:hypothetical protein SAMD00019534_112720 [Acytostelium subglobosum LB1]GAM28096.1 hypothetical protein SAMD00019534_112720 [Acytostelium subglobosum LB1]|eukprot:XP_012749055.1 hypothetical protein SAMD00019534_112720 [Acytostelium subglobosum LB1]